MMDTRGLVVVAVNSVIILVSALTLSASKASAHSTVVCEVDSKCEGAGECKPRFHTWCCPDPVEGCW